MGQLEEGEITADQLAERLRVYEGQRLTGLSRWPWPNLSFGYAFAYDDVGGARLLFRGEVLGSVGLLDQHLTFDPPLQDGVEAGLADETLTRWVALAITAARLAS